MNDRDFWTIFMICLLSFGAIAVVRKHIIENHKLGMVTK